MTYQKPTYFGVVNASRRFLELDKKDALSELRSKTKPVLNLELSEHPRRLLEWLNKWGCRIKTESFPALSPKLTEWSRKWRQRLPRKNLDELEDSELGELVCAYGELRDIPFGATAASKVLFAVCPKAAIPWDAAIRKEFLLSSGGKEDYRKMLMRSQTEARELMDDCKRRGLTDRKAIMAKILETGSRAETLAHLLDQYHWVVITRRATPTEPLPNRHRRG